MLKLWIYLVSDDSLSIGPKIMFKLHSAIFLAKSSKKIFQKKKSKFCLKFFFFCLNTTIMCGVRFFYKISYNISYVMLGKVSHPLHTLLMYTMYADLFLCQRKSVGLFDTNIEVHFVKPNST